MLEKKVLNLGTRSSPLAMAQANLAANAIRSFFPEYEVNIYPVRTSGDKDRVRSLVQFGGTGVFVKELEEALLEKKIDFAVHSLKDVPEAMASELVLGGFLPRACPLDVLVSSNKLLAQLPQGAKIGTGSPRRILQLKAIRSDLCFVDVRGNLESRLQKVESGELDGIILGAAGLERLNLSHAITEKFSPDVLVPAVGQGIVGLQCRKDDELVLNVLSKISDSKASLAASIERSWMNFLGGGCRVPMAAFADVSETEIKFYAYLADPEKGNSFCKNILLKRDNSLEKEFEQFAEKFVADCNVKGIPLPKDVEEHALLNFWGKL